MRGIKDTFKLREREREKYDKVDKGERDGERERERERDKKRSRIERRN